MLCSYYKVHLVIVNLLFKNIYLKYVFQHNGKSLYRCESWGGCNRAVRVKIEKLLCRLYKIRPENLCKNTREKSGVSSVWLM